MSEHDNHPDPLTGLTLDFEHKRLVYEIDRESWSADFSFETERAERNGFYEHIAKPSGRVKVDARYLHSMQLLPPVALGPRIELRGLLHNFTDDTAKVEVTGYKKADRELMAGVQGWSLTLSSTGAQVMSPGSMLKWIEDHLGKGPVRVTIAPEVEL